MSRPVVNPEYHPFPFADDGGDLGLRAPVVWNVSGELVAAVERGAMADRLKNEYGPAKRHPNLVFRASELGNILSVRDAKGKASGCGRKPFFRFHVDKYPPRLIDAKSVLNFAKGTFEEGKMETYLREAGILHEGQVMLGAWTPCANPEKCADHPRDITSTPDRGPRRVCGVSAYSHGDPRYPDRSGGLVRGKADFIIDATEWNAKAKRIPLEFKSASSYSFSLLHKEGPKPEHAIQGAFYAHEMDTSHFGVGYVDKESGEVLIFVCRALNAKWWDRAFERCMWMRDAILDGEVPPMPMGVHPAMPADPPGSRYAGKSRMPDDAYFDRVWPCYTWGNKKKRVTACEWYETCHGALPPEPEGGADAAIKRTRKAPRKKEKMATRGGRKLTVGRKVRA